MTTAVQAHQDAIAIRKKNPRPEAHLTLAGLPLGFALEFPFHHSTSGADWDVLHGRAELLDGSGLHADVAIQLTQVVKEVLPSLDAHDVEGAVINAVRKDLDRKQLELLKSGKRQPVAVSSRHYDVKRQRWVFAETSDADVMVFLMRKVFWLAHKLGGAQAKVWIADPYDVMYLNTAAEKLLESARTLQQQGLITLDGEFAGATSELAARAADLEADMKHALEELNAKHEYERG